MDRSSSADHRSLSAQEQSKAYYQRMAQLSCVQQRDIQFDLVLTTKSNKPNAITSRISKATTKRIKEVRTYGERIYMLKRMKKAAHQECFLLSISRSLKQKSNSPIWKAEVLATSGKIYDILISNILSCTCQDYKTRNRKPCKHIYFMIIQVAQVEQLCSRMRNYRKFPLFNLRYLDEALLEKLKQFLSPMIQLPSEYLQEKKIQGYKEDQCISCFTPRSTLKNFVECPHCLPENLKQLHVECVIEANKHLPEQGLRCPTCRTDVKHLIEAYQKEHLLRRDLSDNPHLSKLTKENVSI